MVATERSGPVSLLPSSRGAPPTKKQEKNTKHKRARAREGGAQHKSNGGRSESGPGQYVGRPVFWLAVSRGCAAPGRPPPGTVHPVGGVAFSVLQRPPRHEIKKPTESAAAPACAGTSRGPLVTSRRSLPVADPASLPLLLQRWGHHWQRLLVDWAHVPVRRHDTWGGSRAATERQGCGVCGPFPQAHWVLWPGSVSGGWWAPRGLDVASHCTSLPSARSEVVAAPGRYAMPKIRKPCDGPPPNPRIQDPPTPNGLSYPRPGWPLPCPGAHPARPSAWGRGGARRAVTQAPASLALPLSATAAAATVVAAAAAAGGWQKAVA